MSNILMVRYVSVYARGPAWQFVRFRTSFANEDWFNPKDTLVSVADNSREHRPVLAVLVEIR
jgi:hypothetical protein